MSRPYRSNSFYQDRQNEYKDRSMELSYYRDRLRKVSRGFSFSSADLVKLAPYR